jgi:hypothetical protein
MIKIAILVVALCGVAHAQQPQPQPPPQQPPPSGNKVDAKALMQSGLKLFEAGDFLGALAVFKDAYARFPSAKILLNIGTTLKELKRDSEAANVYQAYLDSPDADPAKRASVEPILTEIDRVVGKLDITVTPADAQVQVNSDDWQPAAKARRYRVVPGSFTVTARKDKFQTEAKQAQIAAGEIATISIALAAIPDPIVVPSGGGIIGGGDSGVRADVETRSRFGAIALAHIDVPLDRAPRGASVLVGATGDVTANLRAQAALFVGPKDDQKFTLVGAFAGASFMFMSGNVRPIASAGFPIFFHNGARFGIRGAGGVEWQVNRHVSVIAELGLEYIFNAEAMYVQNIFVPAIGASGRL